MVINLFGYSVCQVGLRDRAALPCLGVCGKEMLALLCWPELWNTQIHPLYLWPTSTFKSASSLSNPAHSMRTSTVHIHSVELKHLCSHIPNHWNSSAERQLASADVTVSVPGQCLDRGSKSHVFVRKGQFIDSIAHYNYRGYTGKSAVCCGVCVLLAGTWCRDGGAS